MPEVAAERPAHRRTFGPVVLIGLATAGLAAVASAKPWVGFDRPGGPGPAAQPLAGATALDEGTRYPVASAISLVLLATWGVLLVTRGRVRQAFALLAAVSAVGLLVAVAFGYATLPDTAADSYDALMGRAAREPGFTAWFWTTAVVAVAALVPAALAVRLVRHWPEMGRRYDAPVGGGSPHPANDPDQELWNALNEGRDPTDADAPSGDGREGGGPGEADH